VKGSAEIIRSPLRLRSPTGPGKLPGMADR
jgi:hypothetical protein